MKKLFVLCLLTSFLLQADVSQQEGPTLEQCGKAYYKAGRGCPGAVDADLEELLNSCSKCYKTLELLEQALEEAQDNGDSYMAASLQEHIDQEQQNFVQRHPWWSMGGTLTAGALAGFLLAVLRVTCISEGEGSFAENLSWIITGKGD